MKVPFCDLKKVNAELSSLIDEALATVRDSGQYILGEQVTAFENEWAQYCEMDYAVGVGCGLDAMVLMLKAYGIGAGDEVIVPTNTYVATWMAVSLVGARPVPVEPDDTHTIDPRRVANAITRDTKAILAVHLYGRIAKMFELGLIASRYGLRLFVDAAQAHGVRSAKLLGDCAAFSFYPTKNLGGLGDGGAIVTNDSEICKKVRRLRNYGSSVKNVNIDIGMNSRLDELQAAVLRGKLRKLDLFNERRKVNAQIYGHANGVNHIYLMMSAKRESIRAALLSDGIETLIHYPTPPHLQPAYAGKYGRFPIAERFADEVYSIPVGPELSSEQVAYVADRVRALQ